MSSANGGSGASSPLLVGLNSASPSPRAPSASSSPRPYQQHTPTASPQHFHPASATPPAMAQASPGGQYGQYDPVERLKSRMEGYRAHHEVSLHKDHAVMDANYNKIKFETNRLRKQMSASEGGTKAKRGSVGANPAGGGTGRARTGAAAKRSASAASLAPCTGAGVASLANPNPVRPSARVAKTPKLSAKQKRLLKQQSLDSAMPNSHLLLPAPSTSASTEPVNGVTCPPVYKFECHSPDLKTRLGSTASGPVNAHQTGPRCGLATAHQPVKQEPMSGYFDCISVDALQNILDPADASDSKGGMGDLLGPAHGTPLNGHQVAPSNATSMFDFADSGFGADDTLVSNKFGDEEFITKFLKDLDNEHFEPSVSAPPFPGTPSHTPTGAMAPLNTPDGFGGNLAQSALPSTASAYSGMQYSQSSPSLPSINTLPKATQSRHTPPSAHFGLQSGPQRVTPSPTAGNGPKYSSARVAIAPGTGHSGLLLQPVSMCQASDHRMSPLMSSTPSPQRVSPMPASTSGNGPNASVKLKQMAQQQQNKQGWNNPQSVPPSGDFYASAGRSPGGGVATLPLHTRMSGPQSSTASMYNPSQQHHFGKQQTRSPGPMLDPYVSQSAPMAPFYQPRPSATQQSSTYRPQPCRPQQTGPVQCQSLPQAHMRASGQLLSVQQQYSAQSGSVGQTCSTQPFPATSQSYWTQQSSAPMQQQSASFESYSPSGTGHYANQGTPGYYG